MKTPAQVKATQKLLKEVIDKAQTRLNETNDPEDRGFVSGLENAYMLIFDEVYEGKAIS